MKKVPNSVLFNMLQTATFPQPVQELFSSLFQGVVASVSEEMERCGGTLPGHGMGIEHLVAPPLSEPVG